MPKPDLEQVILPARHLELVFAEFEEEDRLDIRNTIIYNVYQEEGYFLVAQTGPPVLRSMVEATVEATFLWQPTPADEPPRYAFNTTIQDLVTKYVLSKGDEVQAIRMSYPRYLYERNIRFSYRLKPIGQYAITLWVEGHKEPLPIIDISQSGVYFSYPKLPDLLAVKPGDRFYIILDFNGERIIRPLVEVVRKFRKAGASKIEFMGVRFLELSTKDRAFFAATIRKIERIVSRKSSGLELRER